MNHFELLSAASTRNSEKLRGDTMQHQISARDALLLAATRDGNLGRMLAAPNRSTSNLGNQSPRFGFHTLPPMRENDVRGVFSSALLSQHQHQHSTSLFGAGGSPGNQRFLVDASVERRRIDYERLQVMHQQVLALTGERSSLHAGHTSGSIRAMLQQEGRGRSPFLEQNKHIANLYHAPMLPPAQRLGPDSGALVALGSSMRKKSSPYVDASSLSDPNPADLARRRTRGGVTEPFPVRYDIVLPQVN